MNICLSESLELIRAAHFFCCTNFRFLCTTQSLLYWDGSCIVCLVTTHSKTSQHVLISFWWQQLCKMRMCLRTSFVDGLLAFLVLSDRSPLLQFMHQDWLVAQCCLRLYFHYRYKECSLRICNKHPKQHRVQTGVGVLLKAPMNFLVASARISDKLIAFPVYKRRDTFSRSLHHPKFMTPFVSLFIRSLHFASCICCAFSLTDSSEMGLWRDNR